MASGSGDGGRAWWTGRRPTAIQASGSKASKRKSGSASSGGSAYSKQLCIDVGQKSFVRTTCPLCGMLWLPGDPTDEELHSKHHQAATDCLRFPGWSVENCVWSEPGKGRVVLIQSSDPSAHLAKVTSLCGFVERVLGMDNGWFTRPLTPHSTHAPTATHMHPPTAAKPTLLPSQRCLLYVTAKKQVAGLLVLDKLSAMVPVQRTHRAARAQPTSAATDDNTATLQAGTQAGKVGSCGNALAGATATQPLEQHTDSDSAPQHIEQAGSHSAQMQTGQTGSGSAPRAVGHDSKGGGAAQSSGPVNAELGVRAVWVEGDSRRQGIASRLLNLARCHLTPGHVVPIHRVAWAESALDHDGPGWQLAVTWTRQHARGGEANEQTDAPVLTYAV